jgi:predicted negative regulator of RcsB-dependent stress response
MREWKRAGHARPKEDDSLWEQFKAAQDKFFDAKDVEDSAVGEEYEKNYEAKLLILENAKKILPVKDIKKARAELRIIQQKWDEIGRVPRTKLAGIESRLEKIESAIRKAEEDAWDKTNSALSERQDSVLTQLNAGIEKLEAKIKTLTDSKAIENAKEELDSKLALLKMFKGESK